MLAPAGTPRSIVDLLNAELGKAMRNAEMASRLSSVTYDPVHRSPAELTQRPRTDYEKIGKLFREFGAKLN